MQGTKSVPDIKVVSKEEKHPGDTDHISLVMGNRVLTGAFSTREDCSEVGGSYNAPDISGEPRDEASELPASNG